MPRGGAGEWDYFEDDWTRGRDVLAVQFDDGTPRVLRAGQLLSAAAQSGHVLYRLQAGWACRFREFSDGSRVIVDIYLPGDIIGFDAVLFRKPLADVFTLTTAAVDTIVYETAPSRLIGSGPAVLYMARLLSERQRRADRLRAAIACLDARGRLATMVLDFYKRLDAQRSMTSSSFNLPLTQHHIGSYLGLTVVHVNRVIGHLRDEGIVNIEKHGVTILNFQALAHLAKIKAGDLSKPDTDERLLGQSVPASR